MKLQNSISKSNQGGRMPDKAVEYRCGEEIVKLSPSIIRRYLVSGGGDVTDEEVGMFLNLCRFQHLNPFLREAYLIKYGNQPASVVVSKEAVAKRAMRNPAYAGQQAGVVLLTRDGQIEYRKGSMVLPDRETLVGGWAKVYVKGYEVPIEAAVSLDEYIGLKNDGSPNGQWARKPGTMIRKTALAQALREAFPADLGGMYTTEETGTDFDETAESTPVVVPQDELQQPVAAPVADALPPWEDAPMDELDAF